MKINKVNLENFKGIEKAEINFGDLTVITGKNSSGKSSVIQSLKYMTQWLKRIKTTRGLTEFSAPSLQVVHPDFITENKDYEAPDNISKDVKNFLTIWNSTGGKYCKYEDVSAHEMLKLESYLHITSPNRRLVDMLNMIVFQDKLGIMKITEKSQQFYDKWLESMDYINDSMRSIRKVQNDCSLLNLCSTNKELTKKALKGFVFDKIQRSDNLFQYLVYLPEIKMTNCVTTMNDLENLSEYKFQIYIFMDEIKLKQKIRILLVE